MVKVTSFWYKEGDGHNFHAYNKCHVLMGVLRGEGFNLFKNTLLKKEWISNEGEQLTQSMVLVTNMRDEYVRNMPKILKGCGWMNQMAVRKAADFLTILYKSDDMYYERMGYLIGRFILLAPAWREADLEGRKYLLHLERLNYFVHEKRLDRISHLNLGWDYLEKNYVEDKGIQRSVDWIIEYLYTYRDQYNPDEVSKLGIKGFYPQNWYPVGRGGLWDAIHAGRG